MSKGMAGGFRDPITLGSDRNRAGFRGEVDDNGGFDKFGWGDVEIDKIGDWEHNPDPPAPALRQQDEEGLPPIQQRDLSGEYIVTQTIDLGATEYGGDDADCEAGAIGGFNSGIFVLKLRQDGLEYVEKRLRARNVQSGRHRHEI